MTKIATSFSIDFDLYNKFLKVIEQNKDDKNRVIEHFITKYAETSDIITSECKTCGAWFSNKLAYCPQCRLIEKRDLKGRRKQEMLDDMKKRMVMFDQVLSSGGEHPLTEKHKKELEQKIKIVEEEIKKEREGIKNGQVGEDKI